MAGPTTTLEENALQEEVITVSDSASNLQALTSLHSHVVSMLNRATSAFVVSITGAVYQMISPYLASLVDRNTPVYYYTLGYETLFVTSFITYWSASHILEDWKGRITWPSIIFGVGIANLSTVILVYYAQTSQIQNSSTLPSPWSILALMTGPLLMILGGILGFSAVRQYSREHGHAVLGHA
jgi:hypothetical protein